MLGMILYASHEDASTFTLDGGTYDGSNYLSAGALFYIITNPNYMSTITISGSPTFTDIDDEYDFNTGVLYNDIDGTSLEIKKGGVFYLEYAYFYDTSGNTIY
jgi:hypothetical protein